jgi:hypothetical protein
MLYLNPDTTNTLTVTWTERASTGDRYILRLTSIAKNTTTDYTLLKSANLSSYTATIGFNTYANTITYNVYEASDEGVFDLTFDSTFA